MMKKTGALFFCLLNILGLFSFSGCHKNNYKVVKLETIGCQICLPSNFIELQRELLPSENGEGLLISWGAKSSLFMLIFQPHEKVEAVNEAIYLLLEAELKQKIIKSKDLIMMVRNEQLAFPAVELAMKNQETEKYHYMLLGEDRQNQIEIIWSGSSFSWNNRDWIKTVFESFQTEISTKSPQ